MRMVITSSVGWRQQGIFDLEEVQYAIVETTGKVSVLPKFSAQTVTPEMLRLQGKDPAPPVVVITGELTLVDMGCLESELLQGAEGILKGFVFNMG